VEDTKGPFAGICTKVSVVDNSSFTKGAVTCSTKNLTTPVIAENVVEPTLVNECSIENLPADDKDWESSNDWEVLSGRASASSISVGGVFVARAGSVRSISSRDPESSSHTTLSVPFKIPRTNSASTIDSQDGTLGPSGKGVLGVDYIEHIVLPTDTLQGICIAYKVSASNLRRANHFTGHSLHSAPKKLLIPLSKQALRTGFIRVQDTDTKEYKLHYFQAECPDISLTEAKAYLELSDWDMKDAIQSAREDKEWEREVADDDELKSGQFGIRVSFHGGRPTLRMKGTGHSPKEKKSKDFPGGNKSKQQKVIIYSKPPAIATKSVLAEDVYNAAAEHSSFGLELKPLPKKYQF